MFEPMEKFIPMYLWDNLMFMGEKDGIYLYKHDQTRRYINVNTVGNFYEYDGNGYLEITFDEAVKHVISSY